MSSLPAGPRGRLRTTYRILSRPFEHMPRWQARYGDLLTVPTMNGDVVLAASPEGARAIFSAPPERFAPFGVNNLACLLGPGSMVLLGGERHRQERKLLMPPFHGDRMRAYARIMAEVTERHVAEAAASGPVRMQDVAQAISLEVIIRAVFGMQEAARARACADAVLAMIQAIHPALLFMPFLHRELGGIGPYARLRRRIEALDVLLREQIERARAAPGEDILSLLVGARYDDGSPMGEAEMCDELRTLLFAGHETTAVSLAWAVDLVHRHPAALARLQGELDALGPDPDPARYAELPYLDAVCKESLRLYPVVTEVLRELRAPLQIGAHEIPAGLGVSPSILLIHRRPELYPEPAAFRPERFLERKFSPFEYLPFGGGHRRCIGAGFASFEMKVALGATLSGWRIQLEDATPPVPRRRNVTMAPRGGVPVHLVARAAAPGSAA